MQSIKNEKTAEIVGLSFGDGSLTRRHSGRDKGRLRFQLRGNITEDKEHYDKYIIPLFNEIFSLNINPVVCNGKDKSYGISIESAKICNLLQELKIPVGIKRELKIPDWITLNENFSKSFLRGLIDTDGSVYCKKDYNYPAKGYIKIRIAIGSISKNLIKESSHLLKNLGIHNLILKDYKPMALNCKEVSRLQIDGPNVLDYFNVISSKNPKHITKFQVWKKFGFCPPRTMIEQRYLMLKESANILSAGVSEPGQIQLVEAV
ncbi:MAG: LAGLIDADG family homing endonuclease [Nanoarchaeota archaeon]